MPTRSSGLGFKRLRPLPCTEHQGRGGGRRAGPELQPPRPPGPCPHGTHSTPGDTKLLRQAKPPSQGLEGQMDSPNGEAETNADKHIQEGEAAGCLGTGGTAAVRTQHTSGLGRHQKSPASACEGLVFHTPGSLGSSPEERVKD